MDRLEGEVEKMVEENKKFSENNNKLEEQVCLSKYEQSNC